MQDPRVSAAHRTPTFSFPILLREGVRHAVGDMFRNGDRVIMAHPRAFRVADEEGVRYMLGDVEDGYALWDKLEPVDRTKLPNADVFLANQKVLVALPLTRIQRRRSAIMLNRAARESWIRRGRPRP